MGIYSIKQLDGELPLYPAAPPLNMSLLPSFLGFADYFIDFDGRLLASYGMPWRETSDGHSIGVMSRRRPAGDGGKGKLRRLLGIAVAAITPALLADGAKGTQRPCAAQPST
jgi:hypothetical protein